MLHVRAHLNLPCSNAWGPDARGFEEEKPKKREKNEKIIITSPKTACDDGCVMDSVWVHKPLGVSHLAAAGVYVHNTCKYITITLSYLYSARSCASRLRSRRSLVGLSLFLR